MRRLMLASLILLATTSTGHSIARQEEGSPARPKSITFTVASSSTDATLPGVSVYVVSKEGAVILGQTDALGQLSVNAETLAQPGNVALLFCKDHFFCGAFRLQEPRFFDLRRRLIQLAPYAIE